MESENNASDLYAQYFNFRNVAPESYRDFRLPAYLKQVLPADRGCTILDIGCGFGQMLRALRDEGYQSLAGIDVAQGAVQACRAEGHDVTQVESIAGFCQKGGRRYDFIIMSHVLEHIEKSEIVATLDAIRTHLLNDGGALVVMTPNAQSHTGCYWAYEDFTHTTIFTAGSLYFVLRSAGFQQVEFIDPAGCAGSSALGRILRRALVCWYRTRIAFWNRVTGSSFHLPSPQIFTFELKALAR